MWNEMRCVNEHVCVVSHKITLWIWNNIKTFVFNKYHSVDTSRKCCEHSLNTHKPVFKQSFLFQNSVLVFQTIILVSIVVMCFNIDSTSFVLLFLSINIIRWCIIRLRCYHCCSHTLNTIMDNDTVIIMKDGTVP